MNTAYTTPKIKVVRVHVSSVLCQSLFGINANYDSDKAKKTYGDGYDYTGW